MPATEDNHKTSNDKTDDSKTNETAERQALEKQIRVLTKKLERSEADRRQLEMASDLREKILKGVIREFEDSQAALENRSHELELTLEKLKSLQVKLIESEKMSALGILVAGIAHEINNPVNFIQGNLTHAHHYFADLLHLIELYQQHYPKPITEIGQQIKTIDLPFLKQDLGKLLQSMRSGAERIADIVRSFRTFSRLDEATCKWVDLHEGIESTLLILNQRLQPTLQNPTGICVMRDYGKLPLVECYASQLNQVFLNLLVNAIDALEQANQQRVEAEKLIYPNTIWVRTYQSSPTQVVVAIADNGIGISQTIRPRLFDPFFTTKPIGQGTGLGLAISYQVITELHRGQLDVYSVVGQLTEFIITLPIGISSLEPN